MIRKIKRITINTTSLQENQIHTLVSKLLPEKTVIFHIINLDLIAELFSNLKSDLNSCKHFKAMIHCETFLSEYFMKCSFRSIS